MSGDIKDVYWGNATKNMAKAIRPDFLGRNGICYCDGISVLPYSFKACKSIVPMTSKGNLGQCSIDIPVDSVPDVVLAMMPGLEEFLKAAEKYLPAFVGSKDPAMRALIEKRMKG